MTSSIRASSATQPSESLDSHAATVESAIGAAVMRLLRAGPLTAPDSPDILRVTAQRLAEEVATLLPETDCLIATIPTDKPETLAGLVGTGVWGKLGGAEWPLQETISGLAMKLGRPMEPGHQDAGRRSFSEIPEGGHASIRVVPLAARGATPEATIAMGAMVFRRAGVDPFDDSDRAILDAYAQLAGMSLLGIENRLAAVRTAERFRAGVEVALELGEYLDPHELVRRLLARAALAVDADRATLGRVEGGFIVIEGSFDKRGLTFKVGEKFKIGQQLRAILKTGEPGQGIYEGRDIPARVRPQLADLRHTATIPLVFQNQLDSVLSVSRWRGREFRSTDLEALRQIGGIAVLALRNARLYAAAHLAHEQAVDTLIEISRHVETSENLPEFFGRLAATVAGLVSAEKVAFWAHDPINESLSLQLSAFGFSPQLAASIGPLPCHPGNDSATEAVVLKGLPVRIAGGANSKELAPYQRTLELIGSTDMLAVPWRAGDTVLGMLAAHGSTQDGGFSDEDLSVLQVAALAAGLVWQHKRAEDRLAEMAEQESATHREHARRMESLEDVKSAFLKLASHELRGPLGVLNGYVDMMADRSLSAAQVDRVIPILQAKLGQMNLLINEMLETARLEDARLELDRREMDLRESLRDVCHLARPLLDDRHRLHLRLPHAPVVVLGDHSRLETILSNLVDNAIKYSPAGGDIWCSVTVSRGKVRVTITDPGIGISPDDLPRLFVRFGRLVTQENSHISGTGLGLYLSRELARMHGGEIKVRSKPGVGSTFVLSLPRPPIAST